MITLEAKSEKGWPFTFYIEKASPIEENGELIVEGVASTMNVDHDHERMSESALQSMSNIINEEGVPLRLEHSKEDSAIIGKVYKAWIDDRNQLWIRAAMEKGNSTGAMIHESLKQGTKFGLSVGGRVRNAVRELAESTGKAVKTFYDVILDEVSVTRKPANYDAWLFAKSYKSKEEDVTPFLRSPIYNEFLFENPQLDYVRQFAKSIPDKAWAKIIKNSDNNINMNDKDKKTEDMDKSFVTKSEFNQLMKMVADGFSAIHKAMGDAPKDTVNPDKKKAEDDTQQTAKAREGQEDEGGNGTEDAEGKKESDKGAKDQAQPSKDKPVPKEMQTAKKIKVKSIDEEEEKEKAEDGEKKEGEEKEKSTDGEKKEDMEKAEDDKDEKKEKATDGDKEEEAEKAAEGDKEEEAEKSEDDEKDLPSAMKSMADAIKSISNIAKKSEKVTKSEKVEKSQLSELDKFAVTVATAVDALNEKFEKNGLRIPGLARSIADFIKNDPELQKELASMVKMPGFKKSMTMGIPFMVTKEGQRFALSATPMAEKIQKSEKPKNFKDAYKSEYSAFRPDAQI